LCCDENRSARASQSQLEIKLQRDEILHARLTRPAVVCGLARAGACVHAWDRAPMSIMSSCCNCANFAMVRARAAEFRKGQ
jgi:hypothetical protein